MKKSIVLILAMFISLNIFATGQGKKGGKDKKKKKAESAKTERIARAVMWKDPGLIEEKNLFYGEGGQEAAPNSKSKFTFVENVISGTQKKITVLDEKGRKWTVKFGPEAKPEIAAARLLWAVGYHTDDDFFVPKARIEGYTETEVVDVRFERKDDGFKTLGNWNWYTNPFTDTREFDGLRVMNALIRNWDLKPINNKIVRPSKNNKTDDPDENIYYVSDLGATFGRSGTIYNKFPFLRNVPADRGPFTNKSEAKGSPQAYEKEQFIGNVKDGRVTFFSQRKEVSKIIKNVSVDHARWIGGYLARLSDQQIADAFRAGGFNDEEIRLYVRTVRDRIQQLQKL